ncbi:MAG: glycosyltransferase [Leptolyngbya sp. Prado105]|jgi:glycosyltransferase involved in cell wall biosynthesis|nr:glycosyltransferase [Leptolyngbya sp. Prado105]
MTHILVYTDAAGIGGAEISLGNLLATVPPEMQITIAGIHPPVIDAIAKCRPNSKPIKLSNFAHHLRVFRKFDIIHFNCCTPWANRLGLTAALFLPQLRILRVDQLPLRTTDAATLWTTRALCLRVDAHVAVGQKSAELMENFYALGRNSVLSIPNGVPDSVAPAPPRSSSPMIVGSIGRLDAMKAHDILLQALAQVEKVQAVILGEGDERSNLEKLAIELGIRDRVQFRGWVDHPRAHLAEFDVVAMPSRSEGFPLAMVEAMLAEKPVIATRVGSMPEAIVPDRTGLLIEKNDINGLARALAQFRDQSELRIKLGQQARQDALEQWTSEAMAAKYRALWESVLSAPPKPRLIVDRPKD